MGLRPDPGHQAVTHQEGSNNALGVIQIGRGQFTDVHQSGSGNVTLVIQGGF